MSLLAATGVALVRWPRIGFPGGGVLSDAGADVEHHSDRQRGGRRTPHVSAARSARHARGRRRSAATRAARLPRPSRATATAAYVRRRGGLTAMVLAALAIRTMARNAEYASPLTLWTTVVDRFPHGRARMALATELVDARSARAGDRDPARGRARFSGRARGARHRARAATDRPRKASRCCASSSRPIRRASIAFPAYALLAETLAAQHDLEGAAHEWRAIVGIAPSDLGRARAAGPHAARPRREARLRQDDGAGGRAVREGSRAAGAARSRGAQSAGGGAGVDAAASTKRSRSSSEALQLAPNDPQVRANLERALPHHFDIATTSS